VQKHAPVRLHGLTVAALALVLAGSAYGQSNVPLKGGIQENAPGQSPGNPTITIIDVPSARTTYALEINAAGQVVGRFTDAAGREHGFLRSSDGQFSAVDVPGAGHTQVNGINNAGQIVGSFHSGMGEYKGRFFDARGYRHGFLRSREGRFSSVDVPNARDTQALGINDAGQVVGKFTGAADPMGVYHGFLRSPDGRYSLIDAPGAAKTYAAKINNAGQIAGTFKDAAGRYHGYLRSADGQFSSIDVPGAKDTLVEGLNDVGQIGGWFVDAAGREHGFLRNPDGRLSPMDVQRATDTHVEGLNTADWIEGWFKDAVGIHGFVTTTEVGGCWIGMPAGKLCTEGGYFHDETGRVVILRGVNIAGTSKIPPFLPLPSPSGPQAAPPMKGDIMLTRDFDFVGNTYLNELRPLPRWGINVLRLIFVWEAYEPIEGERSVRYLQMLDRIIEAAWQRGIYTIIDFHQDVFSRWMAKGCGEGFPQWTQLTPTLNRPRNDASCADWMLKGIMDSEMHLNFNQLYNGAVKRNYLSVIDTLVQRYADKPGVIGFDVLNEPFASLNGVKLQGLNFRNAIMSLQTVDDGELSAFYQEVAARFKGLRTIMFLEPDLYVDTGIQSRLRAPVNFAQVAYAPHFYDPDISPPLKRFQSVGHVEDAFHNMSERARSWNAPLFIGEFGAAATTENVAAYMDALHAAMNEYFASAAQWSYTPGWTPASKDGWNGEDLSIVAPGGPDESGQGYRPLLFRARAYPQRIAGWPQRLTVQSDAQGGFSLTLLWTNRPSTGGETVIFVPQSPSFSQTSGVGGLSIETSGARPDEMTCRPEPDGVGIVRVVCRAAMVDRRTLQVIVTGH
jgi:endoglycosylceramidase